MVPLNSGKWSEETSATLQDCLETTNWEALCSHGEDIDNLTNCFTGYINFCVDINVPLKSIHYFPKNKPWATKDIKVLLNERRPSVCERHKDPSCGAKGGKRHLQEEAGTQTAAK